MTIPPAAQPDMHKPEPPKKSKKWWYIGGGVAAVEVTRQHYVQRSHVAPDARSALDKLAPVIGPYSAPNEKDGLSDSAGKAV